MKQRGASEQNRRIVVERDGLYQARPDELPVLRYYANSIEHLLEKVSAL